MLHARPDYQRIQDPEGRIPVDEPVFLLRAKDISAAGAVRCWASLAKGAGAADDIVNLALVQADKMEAWAVHQVPDMPAPVEVQEELTALSETNRLELVRMQVGLWRHVVDSMTATLSVGLSTLLTVRELSGLVVESEELINASIQDAIRDLRVLTETLVATQAPLAPAGTSFRKKPVVIAAVQFTGDNVADIRALCDAPSIMLNLPERTLSIATLEGVMRANIGDWVIRGIQGEVYPCKADIFAATYEAVSAE